MKLKLLLVLAFLAAPLMAHAEDIDSGKLVAIRSTRTVVAEAALVADARVHGLVGQTYANQMQQEALDELKSLAKQAQKKTPELSPITQQAIAATQASDIARLRAITARLLAMEGPHGRAD
jgi:hypothetical protein